LAWDIAEGSDLAGEVKIDLGQSAGIVGAEADVD
jgi:hypothetical protein